MTDFAQDTAAPEAGTPIPGEAPPPSREPDAPAVNDTESRARAMGWVSKDEFRGPPENWRDADEFVRRGEEELPIVRERNRDLTRKLADLEAKLNQRDQTYTQQVQRLERMSQLALERQYDQLRSSYETAMREAVQMGDVQRYDQLRQDYGHQVNAFQNQLRQDVGQPQQPQFDQQRQQRPNQPFPPPVQAQGEIPPQDRSTIDQWAARNPWFTTNDELHAAMQLEYVKVKRNNPNMALGDALSTAEKNLKGQYADMFGMGRPTGGQTVEGGSGRVPVSFTRTRGARDLPADARAQGQRFVKDGLFKSLDEYATRYFEQE